MNKLLVLVPCALILVYLPIWASLLKVWSTSDDYSHGFLMVPVALYILWQKREKLMQLDPHPSIWGLVLLVISLMFYIMGYFAEIKTLAYLSMILSWAAAILYFYGVQALKESAIALLILVFMIPIPEQIYTSLTIPLQLFVSQISVWISMVFGLPIFREGNVIQLPEHTLEVVQACSGIRSLMSLLALCLIISYLFLRSNYLRFILFLSGIPFAILINILRVLLIIIAFYFFDYDITMGTVHTILGVVFFALSICLVFFLTKVLSFWDMQAQEK